MDIPAISGVGSPQEPSRAEFAQRRQNFDAVEKALQSGDLSGAQQAFVKIQQNAPPPPPTGTDTNNQASSQASTAKAQFDALGKALQSGDLAGAKKALASIKAGMKAHRHRHSHGTAGTTQQNVSNVGTTLTTGSTDANSDKQTSKLNVAA